MSDIGMMYDLPSLQAALTEAHGSIRRLLRDTLWGDQRSWDAVPVVHLEQASFNFHQLSALLDLLVQERTTAARPQEEANDHTRTASIEATAETTAPPMDDIHGGGEEGRPAANQIHPTERE